MCLRFGRRGAPHPDRPSGPKIRAGGRAEAEFDIRPATGEGRGGEAKGWDWPTPRLGRWSGATQQAGTDVALTRAAIRGHPTLAATRLGQERVGISLSGRVAATARTAWAGAATGVGRN